MLIILIYSYWPCDGCYHFSMFIYIPINLLIYYSKYWISYVLHIYCSRIYTANTHIYNPITLIAEVEVMKVLEQYSLKSIYYDNNITISLQKSGWFDR